jgi:hypothetical protein
MRTAQDVEAYLDKLNRNHAPVEGQPGTYVLRTAGNAPIALRVDPPLVVLRVHIGEIPEDAPRQAELFKKLLELNVRVLVHTSFGLEGTRIVLSSALELENLDFNEIEAVLDEIDLTLADQVPGLANLAKADAKPPSAGNKKV